MSKLPSQEEFEAIRAERKEIMRQGWIRVMEVRIVREELSKCYKLEGVNHYSICKPLVETYMDLLKDAKIKGYRQVLDT